MDFQKVNFLFFLRSLFFLTAPPSLSKTPTDMVKTKSNMIFHHLTIRQTYFYFFNTFIDFEIFLKVAVNHFIHQNTVNCLDILFGNILKETLFSWFLPTKTSTRIFLVAKKKCKSVWRKLKKHPLIKKKPNISIIF